VAVDFAGPYYLAGQAILVVEGNRDIEGPQDLNGRTVCTTTGSTPADVLRQRRAAWERTAGVVLEEAEPPAVDRY